MTWEGQGDEVQLCRDKVRNNSLELNLERDTKCNRKGFCRCANQRRKVKEGVTPSDKKGQQRTDGEKVKVHTFLPQSSMAASLLTPLKWMDSRMGTGGGKVLPLLPK